MIQLAAIATDLNANKHSKPTTAMISVKVSNTTDGELNDGSQRTPSKTKMIQPLNRWQLIWRIINPVLLVIGCSFCFSLSYFAAKSLDGITSVEFGSIRSALMAIMLLIPAAIQRNLSEMFRYGPARTKLLFRCTLGVIGTVCIYTGVKFIDLPDFMSIQYTYLVMTAILARIVLKEKFGIVKVIATLVTLIGVIMVIKPNLFRTGTAPRHSQSAIAALNNSHCLNLTDDVFVDSVGFNRTLKANELRLQLPGQSKNTTNKANAGLYRTAGVILSLSSAFVSACVFCVVKRLVTGEHALKGSMIVFNCSLFTAGCLLLLSFFHRLLTHSIPAPNWANAGYVLLGSLSALFAHLLQNEALRVSSATFVAIGRSSSIVFSFLFQAFISKQSVTEKNLVSFIGIAIIVIGVTTVSIDTMLNRT